MQQGGGGDRPKGGGGDFLGKIPTFCWKKLEKSQILAPQAPKFYPRNAFVSHITKILMPNLSLVEEFTNCVEKIYFPKIDMLVFFDPRVGR